MDHPEAPRTVPFAFDAATVDLVLEGLAELPYKRVAATIQSIHAHALHTLSAPPQAAPEPAVPARRLRSSHVRPRG